MAKRGPRAATRAGAREETQRRRKNADSPQVKRIIGARSLSRYHSIRDVWIEYRQKGRAYGPFLAAVAARPR